MYDVIDVCRHVINYSNEKGYGISNLKLQKLLYFIQAFYLISGDGEPCFKEEIEAWDFGPVVPRAYREYRICGSSLIPTIKSYSKIQSENGKLKLRICKYNDDVILDDDKELINSVVDKFKLYSASELVQLTHNQKPWKDAYYSEGKNSTISLEAIRSYFNE